VDESPFGLPFWDVASDLVADVTPPWELWFLGLPKMSVTLSANVRERISFNLAFPLGVFNFNTRRRDGVSFVLTKDFFPVSVTVISSLLTLRRFGVDCTGLGLARIRFGVLVFSLPLTLPATGASSSFVEIAAAAAAV
jgi:hypothetical protein